MSKADRAYVRNTSVGTVVDSRRSRTGVETPDAPNRVDGNRFSRDVLLLGGVDYPTIKPPSPEYESVVNLVKNAVVS